MPPKEKPPVPIEQQVASFENRVNMVYQNTAGFGTAEMRAKMTAEYGTLAEQVKDIAALKARLDSAIALISTDTPTAEAA